MRRGLANLLGVLLLASLSVLTLPAGYGDCVAIEEAASRATCLEDVVASGPPGSRDARRLYRLVADHPRGVLDLVERVEASDAEAVAEDRALRTRLHDLRGLALQGLDRPREAAEALRAALELDDGTARLSWLGTPPDRAWETPVGLSVSRLEWAAKSLLGADEVAEARCLLSEALVLGAEGWAQETWSATGGGRVAGLDETSTWLAAPPWRQPLPALTVPLLGGGTFTLTDAVGKVLILDFWASWCAPCAQELPRLQLLYDAERTRGLHAVAVNLLEPEHLVREFAAGVGLSMPIGLAGREVENRFKIRSLPVVVLADRRGRIRGRWDEYRPGLEREIAEAVRALIEEEREDPIPVIEVVHGKGLLQLDWLREAGRTIEGLAILRDGETFHLAVTLRERLTLFAPDGQIVRRVTPPSVAYRLRSGDWDGDGRDELVGFRRGAEKFVLLDPAGSDHEILEAQAPVLDVEVLPESEESPGGIILATLAGLERLDRGGKSSQHSDGLREVSDVALAGGESAGGLIALEGGSRLLWLDRTLAVARELPAPPTSWTLLTPPGDSRGVGVAPSTVVAAVTGKFIGTETLQAALALDSGQLVLVGLDTGRVLFRARWEGLAHLAAVDFDGDGRQELIAAAGRNIAVLRGTPH